MWIKTIISLSDPIFNHKLHQDKLKFKSLIKTKHMTRFKYGSHIELVDIRLTTSISCDFNQHEMLVKKNEITLNYIGSKE